MGNPEKHLLDFVIKNTSVAWLTQKYVLFMFFFKDFHFGVCCQKLSVDILTLTL